MREKKNPIKDKCPGLLFGTIKYTEPLEVMFFKVFVFLIETNQIFSSNKKFPTHFTNIFNSNPKFSKMNVVNIPFNRK